MSKREVEPKGEDAPPLGAVRLGHECEHGYREICFVDTAGEIQQVCARKVNGARSEPPGDYEVGSGQVTGQFTVGRRIDGGRGRGPARVSSRAYRSKWDETFGRHGGKAS